MRLALPLLVLALVALPACDAVSSVIDSLSQPSSEELQALTTTFGCPVVGISNNGSREGTLAGGDCVLPSDNSLMDLYAFRVTSETSLRITMESTAFPPYVLLFDDGVNLLNQRGAAEGSHTVTMDYAVNAGTFVIGANAIEPGQTGRYTVRVERQD